MKCSKLNHDLSVNNIIENDLCNCGNIETAFHFFLECPLYTIFRNDLQMETMFLPNLSLNIILNDDVDSLQSAILEFILPSQSILLKQTAFKFLLLLLFILFIF